MNPYRYKISLRLHHPSLDPGEITRALGLIPLRSLKAGEPRTTPKGNPLEGINRETFWTARMIEDQWPGKELPVAVNACLDQLVPQRDFFHRIRSEGGAIKLRIGWFFEGMSGGEFDCDLLARMADLKIDLSLDMYPPDRVVLPSDNA
jgi:hypothetical protein